MHAGIIALFLSLALPSVGFAAATTDDNSAQPQDPAIPDPKGREFFSKIPFGTFQGILKNMSLLDIYNLGKTQAKYWNNPNFWDVMQATRPHQIRDGKTAVQIARYMKNNLSEMIKDGGSSLARNDKLLPKIEAVYTPEFAQGIHGFLNLMIENIDDGMRLLNQPETVVTEGMQNQINHAARFGELGFNYIGYAYLGRISGDVTNPGRQHAQEKFNEAARNGELDFTDASGRKYLEKRARHGDAHAQSMLKEDALLGNFGFTRGTDLGYFFAVYNVLTGGK